MNATKKCLSLALTAMAALKFQGCLNDDNNGGTDNPAKVFSQTLYATQEGNLAAFDLETGNALPGSIADVKSPTDLQALEDGTLLVNLSASNEILAVDGKTILQKARLASSGGAATRPVHFYITALRGRQAILGDLERRLRHGRQQ